jgi:hypothetical protein
VATVARARACAAGARLVTAACGAAWGALKEPAAAHRCRTPPRLPRVACKAARPRRRISLSGVQSRGARGMPRRTSVAAAAAAAAVLGIVMSLAWQQRPPLQTGATVLAQYDCGQGHRVLVDHGFKVRCTRAAMRAVGVAVTSLALKRQHSDLAPAHKAWCDRWCVLERTSADCSSCVQPSFPGYMARMKASEHLSAQGWGIHIPTADALRAEGAAHSDSAEPQAMPRGLVSVEEQAVAGHDATPGQASLGDLTAEEQDASVHVMHRDAAGRQALYQLQSSQQERPTTKEQAMASMERSEEADERRLVADEKRLARDRAIKQRLLRLRLQQDRLPSRRRQSREGGAGMAAFLASRHWHRAGVAAEAASAPAPASKPRLRAAAPPAPSTAIGASSPSGAGRDKVRKEQEGHLSRQLLRRSIENNLDPRQGAHWLAVHLAHKVKLPKLKLTPQYTLPGESVGGLWNGWSGSQGAAVVSRRPGELDAGATASARASKPRLSSTHACHNAYDCFGALFEGHTPRHGAQAGPAPRRPPKVIDPKAFIKGQGLGCHTLGNCLGDFFGQSQSAGKAKSKGPNALVSSKVNLDGWSTSQFTKGLEKGMNMFPPDQKDALLQRVHSAPEVALEQLGDGNSIVSGFIADVPVPQQVRAGGRAVRACVRVCERVCERVCARVFACLCWCGSWTTASSEPKLPSALTQMGEAPADSCCGGDAVAPIASLGRGVWQFGHDVKNAEVSTRPVHRPRACALCVCTTPSCADARAVGV